MRFKFPSSGQQAADASIVSQIIRGRSLLPLAPVNVQGFRDAAGNLTISWTRRSRIGAGMRPGSDVPLGEEQEWYDVDIVGTSRTIRIRDLNIQPVPWDVNVAGFFRAYRTQMGFGPSDSFFDTKINFDNGAGGISGGEAFIWIENATDFTKRVWQIYLNADGSKVHVTIDETFNGATTNLSTFDTPVAGAAGFLQAFHVRFAVEHGQARFYVPFIAGSAPTAVGNVTPYQVGQLRPEIFIDTSFGSVVMDEAIIADPCHAYYPASQQTADGITPGNPVTVRVMQVSPIVGRGSYTQVTL